MDFNTTINLQAFVENIDIEPKEYMLPLLEVVVNAIQSIEDRQNKDDRPLINIKVIRDISQKNIDYENHEPPYKPIVGFEVTDNGIGFIDDHMSAFNEIFTSINQAKGCKGVGRYSVLACFNSMNIDSTYFEHNEWKNRSFKYDPKKGITYDGRSSIDGVVLRNKLCTKITLNEYKDVFRKYIIANKISNLDLAEGIIHHCLLYFTSNEIPLIKICDKGEEEKAIIINDIFRDIIQFDRDEKIIKVKDSDENFILNYVRNFSSRTHSMHLCANNREVGNKISLSTHIPSFVKPILSGDKSYYLSVYVTSKFLDKKVNSQRTKFLLPEREEDKAMFDSICLSEIYDSISDNVKKEYESIIAEAEKEKKDRIRSYILNKDKPRLAYRHLLNVDDAFIDIPANATDERIETELHQKVFQLEQKRTKAFNKAFSKKKYDKKDFTDIVHSVLSEEARFSADKLADLMIRRKAIIKLFKKYLEWRNEDKQYMLESDLHNIIFTMGAETDVIPRDYHNLWLLDERLAFHSYATSDRPMKTNPHINNNSAKETDLLIYDFPWAYADNPNNINSLVIFEFKRPGRDMNTIEDKKLDIQVVGYFEKLMESKARNDNGRLMNVQDNTPKYGYVICDLHKDLENYNIKFNGFRKTPHDTLFKINDMLNMYIEVMSYDTMIEFAEKRHNSFFQALGIDVI